MTNSTKSIFIWLATCIQRHIVIFSNSIFSETILVIPVLRFFYCHQLIRSDLTLRDPEARIHSEPAEQKARIQDYCPICDTSLYDFSSKTLVSFSEDHTTIGACWRYNSGRDTHILRVTLNDVLFFYSLQSIYKPSMALWADAYLS